MCYNVCEQNRPTTSSNCSSTFSSLSPLLLPVLHFFHVLLFSGQSRTRSHNTCTQAWGTALRNHSR